ncbi:MAG: right-handed parallel beta-helix repeat-containing protein [Candidatus Weimeria sp.]
MPSKSSGGYTDDVTFSLKSWKTTGDGRNDSDKAIIKLSSSGNSCTVTLSNLLDYETYEVTLSYTQTYYYDSPRSDSWTDSDGVSHPYIYYVKESSTVRGTLSDKKTTPVDTVIRNAWDLKEKVHKYPSLSLGADIDCGSIQADVDGLSRQKWLVSGPISAVTISGGGHTIKRGDYGFIFHVFNGARLTLENAVLHAFSGELVHTKTYGGEYETLNSTGNDEGCGIEVGYDSAFDEHESSTGHLVLSGCTVLAHNSAIVIRNGDASVSGSYLYGMGEKGRFSYTNFEDFVGTGILLQNSGKVRAKAEVSKSTIYGRYNGILLWGDSDSSVTGCEVRGDCGDAFDFRSSGNMSVSGCKIYGIRGIDVFDDASYAAVEDALRGDIFDRKIFQDKIGKKGTVTVSDTSMSLITGAFSEDAETNCFGVQNRGNLIIGKNVTINTSHSGAWETVAEEDRAECCGIYNCMRLDLPDDIRITSDDIGITENRNIGIIRNYIVIRGGDQEKAKTIERAVTRNSDISSFLDFGNNSVLTITGGKIDAADTGIDAQFGSVYIESGKNFDLTGRLRGIVIGKNGPDNILDDDAMGGYLEINGTSQTNILTSLQGYGICVKESGRAVLTGNAVRISDENGPCGTGIKNEGNLFVKNAAIEAQKSGITNQEAGTAYIGDDLDEEGNQVEITGAVCGIKNNGTMYYYRDVVIENSLKAAVWQNGIFYMLPGAAVKTGSVSDAVFLTSRSKDGETIKSTVRILYEKQYEDDLPSIEASFNTSSSDRKPGRVMVELYSADGTTDLSDISYQKADDEEKLRITKLLTGFSLCFDQINGHRSALRCGLGDYVPDEEKKADIQPEAGTATNGRTGTIVLSCLLSGIYDADFPVKDSRISSKTPEATEFYWREPQEFGTAPVTFVEDRCRIFWEKRDITAGLKQTGYREKDKDGYKKAIYAEDRIIRIFGDDHTFYAVWDTDFSMIFDGNGQTNGAENYTKKPVDGSFVFDGNTGPDGNSDEYFVKSVTRKKYDYETMTERQYQHQTSFQGFSFDKNATYRDDGVYCRGDKLHGPSELVSDETFTRDYPDYGAVSFYIYAVEKNQVSIEKDKASVRIYAVWDEYPVISAQDISFYADELSDESAVLDRLLSENSVTVSDFEDGEIDRKYIAVYTDPVKKIFSSDAFKQMGDSGSVSIYYSVTDKNDADLKRFKQNLSTAQAKVCVMSDDSEDTSDDIPQSTARGNAGTSSDTYYSAPIYVRAVSSADLGTLEPKSVWKEESYRRLLGQATAEETEASEKWVFGSDDIIRSKEILYKQNADVLTWRNEFIANCVMDEKTAESQKNKPLIVNEGLSSVHLTWDITSETDSAEITLSQWGDSGTRIIDRKSNQKMCSGTVFSNLKPDEHYLVTADFYYRGRKQMTYKETVHTRKLSKPEVSLYRDDTGDEIKLRLSFEKDSLARKYVIERECLKGVKTKGYQVIKEIDEFTENENGERYFDSDVITYHTTIEDEGVYRYRVKALGSRLFSDELTEESEYSEEAETAFLKRPVISSTEAGCRSIRLYLMEHTAADFVRVSYQSLDGGRHYMDIVPDMENSCIISELMKDDTVYFISAVAHIRSTDSGREYVSLGSEVKEERTLLLTGPELLFKKQKDIYTGEGIKLVFSFDKNALCYQLKEDILYQEKREGAYEPVDTTPVKSDEDLPSDAGENGDATALSAECYKKGGDSRVSEYTLRAVYRTLDDKEFYLESETVRAAFIRKQEMSGKRIERGSTHKESIARDENASVYLLTVKNGDTEETIYVPSDRTDVVIYSPDASREVASLNTVMIYDGVEYRGAC